MNVGAKSADVEATSRRMFPLYIPDGGSFQPFTKQTKEHEGENYHYHRTQHCSILGCVPWF